MADNNKKIKTLARNIKANPNDSFSKFALALEFLKQDDIRRAKMLFEDVYQNDPDYVGVYYHLGKLYERLDDLSRARQLYEEGIPIAAEQKESRTKQELEEALAQVNIEIDHE